MLQNSLQKLLQLLQAILPVTIFAVLNGIDQTAARVMLPKDRAFISISSQYLFHQHPK